jgi:hypothetical protein
MGIIFAKIMLNSGLLELANKQLSVGGSHPK